MKRVKLTIEQFREFKDKLLGLIDQAETFYEENNTETTRFMDEIKKQYMLIQEELFSYDLSLVPFEEWDGLEIMGVANLSGTSANIDFEILDYTGLGNFHGCNVRNLNHIKRFINERDFDETTISNNPELFLSDKFDNEFKQKYYTHSLKLDDIVKLAREQLEELEKKDIKKHFAYGNYIELHLFEVLGLEKLKILYDYSVDDFNLLCETFEYGSVYDGNIIIKDLKTIEVNKVRDWCFEYIKGSLFVDTYRKIDLEILPKIFVENNKDILLIDETISDELREKYYNRNLAIQDVIDNIGVFQNISVEFFINENKYNILDMANTVGKGIFQKLIKSYPEAVKYFVKSGNLSDFIKYYKIKNNLDDSFLEAVKEYIINNQLPDELVSMNFEFMDEIRTRDDLMSINKRTILLAEDQRRIINWFGIENIKKLEQETGFFSRKANDNSYDLEMFEAISDFYLTNGDARKKLERILGNSTVQYEEFLEIFAMCLDDMRANDLFTDYPDYDWMQGEFRENHPEIFVSLDAPKKLRDAFYKNNITPEFLYNNKEYIPYLLDKDLRNTIRANINLVLPSMVNSWGFTLPVYANFMEEYISRYGKEKCLQLIAKYGDVLDDIDIVNVHNEIDDEILLEQQIKSAIYKKIIEKNVNYSYLINVLEFSQTYPELFINLDNLKSISDIDKKKIEEKFYTGTLDFGMIKQYPELINVLKDKNLNVAFRTSFRLIPSIRLLKTFQENLLIRLGNEKFLELCQDYGTYLGEVRNQNFSGKLMINNRNEQNTFKDVSGRKVSFENLKVIIEQVIGKMCKYGEIKYSPDDAPNFLKVDYPELFLDDNAPEELKKYFYNENSLFPMSFYVLSNNKEWLPYLKNKAVSTSILRNLTHNEMAWRQYFDLFGEEKSIKLGINRAETVTQMINSQQVEIMKQWYDKTGQKFIPDYVVMQSFRIEDADKFLLSGNNWSSLMRIKNFASSPEARDAILKLAYTFGVFDQDQRGFKQVHELLTGLPRKLDAEHIYIFQLISTDIDTFSERKRVFKVKKVARRNQFGRFLRDDVGNVLYEEIREPMSLEQRQIAYEEMLASAKSNLFNNFIDTNLLVNLLESIKEEIPDFDFSQDIFSQIYRKNEDGSYILAINQQNYPKVSQAVRNMLEKFRELPLLTPEKAHQLFGSFELRYDPDFRDFLLNNFNKIINNYEYISYLSRIQRQFPAIKIANSNRTLTWELAKSYVQKNRYINVNNGNEMVAEISAIAGYDQRHFELLQQIYNYGKQRTFSSIPRIKNTVGKYTYEMLRLDDPLAMAIGTLTDCCQELGNIAEVCMEHSMTDKNGRVFVIRDTEGNIISQSWVWRNKDVLCFDNIEIPGKVFLRITKNENDDQRKSFSDEVYEIYRQAANDLIDTDEKKYKQLLEQGKITKEQYEQLRLGKVTVGLGYNDIADSIKRKSVVDTGILARPLPFSPPVKLSRGLYINDSTTQYIISERKDRMIGSTMETLPLHHDTYMEYDDTNFTEKSLLFLQRLEAITKDNILKMRTGINNNMNDNNLVTALAKNYRLNPKTTKVIMNPNMAVIYDIHDDKIRIGDLLFNTKIDNGQQQLDIETAVILQIWLALDQIKNDKEIDISMLNNKQQEMYNKVVSLTYELDLERGIEHGR